MARKGDIVEHPATGERITFLQTSRETGGEMNYQTPPNAVPTLVTERLMLRPLTPADLDALQGVSNEPLVRRFLWDDEPVRKDAIRDLIVRSASTFAGEGVGLFGVRLRGSKALVGFCGFVRLEGMDEMELAYELSADLWGKGLATEAARACAMLSRQRDWGV